MSFTKKCRYLYSPYTLLILELIFLIPQSRFDPESHHDGVMFGAAIAVKDGLVPHVDVFAQYGPLTPLLQGYWLKLVGPNLFNLRLLSAILLSITGVLMYLIVRKYLTSSVAFLTTMVWCTTYPRYILPPNLPWASIVSTLLTLAAIYFLIDSWKSIYSTSPKIINMFVGSLLLTIGISTRIQLALTLILPTLVIFLNVKNIKAKSKVFLSWGSGIAVGTLLILGYLIQNNALSAFVNQVLIWPAKFYVKPIDFSNRGQIIEILLLLLFPFYLLIFLFALRVRHIHRNQYLTFFWFAICFAAAFTSLTRIEHKSYLNPAFLISAISQGFFQILGYTSVSFIFGIFVVYIFKGKIKEFTPTTLIAIASLVQLYPLQDALHLWWVSPIFLAASASFSRGLISDHFNFESSLKIILLGLLTSSLFLSVNYFSMDRIQSKSVIFKHMLGTKSNILPLDEFIQSINQISKNSRLIFECTDGIFAVSDGRYLASNLNFWDAPIGLVNEYTDGDVIVRCRLSNQNLLDLKKNKDFSIVKQTVYEDGHINVILRFRTQISISRGRSEGVRSD